MNNTANSKMYLTTAEAKTKGLPSIAEQIERYNAAVLATRLLDSKSFRKDIGIAA